MTQFKTIVSVLAVVLHCTGSCIIVAQVPTATTPRPPDTTFQRSLLGESTRLVLSSKDVIQSMAWWSRVGFTPTPGNTSRPDSAITMSDGQLTITLVKDPLPTPILMFATPNIQMLKDSLDSLQIATTFDVRGPSFGELRLLSPSGLHMAVRPAASERRVPTSGDSNIVCGKFMELSVSVTDFPLKRERRYWETLDFSVRKASDKPYSYAIVTDGYIDIGLHEMRDIPSVGLTYFARDMKDRLRRLSMAGITFIDEYKDADGNVEHAYISSPDGQLIMLFTATE